MEIICVVFNWSCHTFFVLLLFVYVIYDIFFNIPNIFFNIFYNNIYKRKNKTQRIYKLFFYCMLNCIRIKKYSAVIRRNSHEFLIFSDRSFLAISPVFFMHTKNPDISIRVKMVILRILYLPCPLYCFFFGVCLLKDFCPFNCPDFLVPNEILLLLPADLIFANCIYFYRVN